MFMRKFEAKTEEFKLADEAAEYKNAKSVGQYKVSDKAFFLPDKSYVALDAVTSVIHDKGSVHVTGCCAGGVMLERLVLVCGDKKYPFLFDTKREVEKALGFLEGKEIINA